MSRRRALGAECPDCGRATLVGPDADVCAITARVDPTPLTRDQELACVLLRRPVYDLDAGRLYDRTPAAVVHAPTVNPHPGHVCGQPIHARRPDPATAPATEESA